MTRTDGNPNHCNTPLPLPSREELLIAFRYCPDTGELRWKERTDCMGRRLIRLKRKCGHKNPRGYLKVGFGGKVYSAHRIIWKMMTGDEPPEVDHRNGQGDDNRFDNLRAATHSLNVKNARSRKGKSLPKGVRKHQSCNKFEARIRVDGKPLYLGLHSTPEEAHAAYCEAATKYHQQFARYE